MKRVGGRALVIGAAGQIGGELVAALRRDAGADGVVAGCHKAPPDASIVGDGPVHYVDAADPAALGDAIARYDVTSIYNLAAIMSKEGEDHPDRAWAVNMGTHKTVLDAARADPRIRVFWPSSIAVFGDHAPHDRTPQHTVLEPTTIYGVTKVAGELLGAYYHRVFRVDVRSIRFPGLITVKTFTGGGTTDYTVEMLLSAIRGETYTCFVRADTMLPLMAMEDAVRSIQLLMAADPTRLTVRTSYNVGALSFTAGALAAEIRRHVPDFRCTYEPDARQAIADSWPDSLDDSVARRDWGWKEAIDLPRLVADVLRGGASSPAAPQAT